MLIVAYILSFQKFDKKYLGIDDAVTEHNKILQNTEEIYKTYNANIMQTSSNKDSKFNSENVNAVKTKENRMHPMTVKSAKQEKLNSFLNPLFVTASDLIKNVSVFNNKFSQSNNTNNSSSNCNLGDKTTSIKYTNIYDPNNPDKISGNNRTGIFLDKPNIPPAGPDGIRNMSKVSDESPNNSLDNDEIRDSPGHMPKKNTKKINFAKIQNNNIRAKHLKNKANHKKPHDERYNHRPNKNHVNKNVNKSKEKQYSELDNTLSIEDNFQNNDLQETSIEENRKNNPSVHENVSDNLTEDENTTKHFFQNKHKSRSRKKKQRREGYIKKRRLGANIQQIQHKRIR